MCGVLAQQLEECGKALALGARWRVLKGGAPAALVGVDVTGRRRRRRGAAGVVPRHCCGDVCFYVFLVASIIALLVTRGGVLFFLRGQRDENKKKMARL